MRHLKKGRKFGRVRKVRKAFIKSLASALILRGKIKTTQARAKEIRPIVEKMVTKAKNNSLETRRLILSRLPKDAAKKLFEEVAPKYVGRPGGYTRITKLVPRKSDGAKMAIIEFV